MYINNEYTPLTLDQAINRTYEVVKECKSSDVKIIRIGLQSTNEISSNNQELVGPICDNFAEYVLSKIALESIERNLEQALSKFSLDKNYEKNVIILIS